MGEIWLKGFISIIVIPVILGRKYISTPRLQKLNSVILTLVAFLSVLAYFNFGVFHRDPFAVELGGKTVRFIHLWDQYHYFLNAKYFKELGYDGLYVASIAARQPNKLLLPNQAFVRDLHSNQIVHISNLDGLTYEVVARFSPDRWSDFIHDNNFFVSNSDPSLIASIRKDHGFNGTPAWTFIAQLFCRTLPASTATLLFLSILDPILLVFMFIAIYRAYGWRIMCLTIIIFGCGYASRFYWTGGAFLRFDWFVASVVGICMLKKEKYIQAGLLLGYATVSRLFPIFLVLGLVTLFVKNVYHGHQSKWFGRFAIGFVTCVLIGLILGSFTGRGVQAWGEFFDKIYLHQNTWLTNNVGLKNVVLYNDITFNRDLVNWDSAEPWQVWQFYMDGREEKYKYLIVALAIIYLVLIVRSAWYSSPSRAATIGIVAAFAFILLTGYYWVWLVLLGFERDIKIPALFFALNSLLFVVHILHAPVFEVIYGFMSWGLAILFIAWVGFRPQQKGWLTNLLSGFHAE